MTVLSSAGKNGRVNRNRDTKKLSTILGENQLLVDTICLVNRRRNFTEIATLLQSGIRYSRDTESETPILVRRFLQQHSDLTRFLETTDRLHQPFSIKTISCAVRELAQQNLTDNQYQENLRVNRLRTGKKRGCSLTNEARTKGRTNANYSNNGQSREVMISINPGIHWTVAEKEHFRNVIRRSESKRGTRFDWEQVAKQMNICKKKEPDKIFEASHCRNHYKAMMRKRK